MVIVPLGEIRGRYRYAPDYTTYLPVEKRVERKYGIWERN